MNRILLCIIDLYKLIGLSGLLPRVCRFWPSCSHYTQDAIRIHGARKGAWLGLCRILRCNPWNPGGVDLVP